LFATVKKQKVVCITQGNPGDVVTKSELRKLRLLQASAKKMQQLAATETAHICHRIKMGASIEAGGEYLDPQTGEVRLCRQAER
jgi:hypothetical protein